METVLDCVIPYIHDRNDLNSISFVSRKFYELDCITRKHVTVHVHYAPSPFRLNLRFPFLESLTLKGFPDFSFDKAKDVTPWIREIVVTFKCLKALRIRHFIVEDSDIELLAKTRGNDLKSLEIYKCKGGLISVSGLMHISKYCDKLTTLCLHFDLSRYNYKSGNWLQELALRNTRIERISLDLNDCESYNEDIAHLLKRCSKSLVSLRIKGIYALAETVLPLLNQLLVYSIYELSETVSSLAMYALSETVLPLSNQLRELELNTLNLYDPFQCSLLERCPNSEVLFAKHVYGDTGLQLVSQYFKKLRKLTFNSGTLMGMIAVAQGCPNMEYLHVKLTDISNDALECIGSNLKNLRDFDMQVGEIENNTRRYLLINKGTRAMLVGCTKLERLGLHLYATAYLTDVGLGFIGRYGFNLRFLSLTRVGKSDEGLLKLSKGCRKLRKLRIMECPFSKETITGCVFDIPSLRYTWGEGIGRQFYFRRTRPNPKASTIISQEFGYSKRYLTLAEQLGKLAGQLLAGESGMKSAKVTYAIGEAPANLDTRLLRTMVAKCFTGTLKSNTKGIRISDERVILDGSSEKPLDIIRVQIADVESRFASAISESGDIQVEGKVKDGVPHLTKVGAYEVYVSLKGNIILCKQVDEQPGIYESIKRILVEESVPVYLRSVGRTAIGQQVVMAIVVSGIPNEKVLKRIDEIPAVKEVVFLSLFKRPKTEKW